jgi:DNA-binding transcriptional LysR family regulator
MLPSAHSFRFIPADQALEEALALKLFDYKGRKLELTPHCEIFYVEARKVLNSVEEAKEKTKNHAADFSGKISLAAPACLRLFLFAELCPLPRRVSCHILSILARSHADAISMARSGDDHLAMGLFRTLLSISRRFR